MREILPLGHLAMPGDIFTPPGVGGGSSWCLVWHHRSRRGFWAFCNHITGQWLRWPLGNPWLPTFQPDLSCQPGEILSWWEPLFFSGGPTPSCPSSSAATDAIWPTVLSWLFKILFIYLFLLPWWLSVRIHLQCKRLRFDP